MDKQLFDRYWKNYSDAIESLLIRRSKSGTMNINAINQEIKTFSRRWQNDRNVEGLWLQDLREENPVKADKIQQIISNIELKSETFEVPSMAKYYLGVVVIGIFSILAVVLMSLSWWKTVLIPILCIMLAWGFLIPQGNSKREQTITRVVRKYVLQIDGFKWQIDQILSE